MNAGRIIVLVVVAAVAGVDFGSMQSVMSTSFVTPAEAQNSKSSGKMLYQDGPILTGTLYLADASLDRCGLEDAR